jgi:hypothetical protein
MEIKLNVEKMKESKYFFATPMYGNTCTGSYCMSMIHTINNLTNAGLEVSINFLGNESLVQRARNTMCAKFMQSPAQEEWLIFLDADLSWRPMDMMYCFHVLAENPEIKILTVPYPKKTISWEKVVELSDNPAIKEDPNVLSQVAADYVVNWDFDEYPDGHIPLGEPSVVKEAGTGFMMIHRSVLGKMIKELPNIEYESDHIREMGRGFKVHAFFDCEIREGRYLSEDYLFCRRARDLGYKIWSLPMLQVDHTGVWTFTGSMIKQAELGVLPNLGRLHKNFKK